MGLYSSTDITDQSATDNLGMVKVKATSANISAGNCFGTVSPSWELSLELHNITNGTGQPLPIRLDQLVIKYYDASSTYLGSTTIPQADWGTWFTSGTFGGGAHSESYYLDPGEYCSACLCAHLGARGQGSMRFEVTYKMPDNSTGTFTAGMGMGEPLQTESEPVGGQIGGMPPGAAPSHTLPEQKAQGGFHISTTVSVTAPGYSDARSLSGTSSVEYTLDGFPNNASNLAGTVSVTSAPPDSLQLFLKDNDGPSTLCTRTIAQGTSPQVCSKAGSLGEYPNLEFQVVSQPDADYTINIGWDVPTVAANDEYTQAMTQGMGSIYYFDTSVASGTDVWHVAEKNLTAGTVARSMELYSQYPSGGSALSCDAQGQWGTDDKYLDCSVRSPTAGTRYINMHAARFVDSTSRLWVQNLKKSEAYDLTGGGNDIMVEQSRYGLFKVTVPSGATSLVVTASALDTDDNVMLLVKKDELPLRGDATCQQTSGTSGEVTCTVNTPAAGTWYITTFGYDLANDTEEGGISATVTTSSAPTEITNGETKSFLAALTEWDHYKSTVESSYDYFQARATNISLNPNLYMRKGAEPTLIQYDRISGNMAAVSESIIYGPVTADDYYCGLYGVHDGNNTGSLTVEWGNAASIADSGKEQSVSASEMQYKVYSYNLASNAVRLGIAQTVGTGDLDIELFKTSLADGNSKCSSATAGTASESCDTASAAAGDWLVAVQGKQSGSNTGELMIIEYGRSCNMAGGVALLP